MQLTSEQKNIEDFAGTSAKNLLINAKAGSGKTTTLIKVLPQLAGTSMLQAFNKSIAKELQLKASNAFSFEQLIDISIGTVHSFGLAAYRKNASCKHKVDGSKLTWIFRNKIIPAEPIGKQKQLSSAGYTFRLIVAAAKNAGFGITSEHEIFPQISSAAHWLLLLEHFQYDRVLNKDKISLEYAIIVAQKLLMASNETLSMLDFDDMIYLPLLFDHPLTTYDNVLIDEAQDISATKREFAFRSMAENGRIIAVGDKHQAIYGFTGAAAESLTCIGTRAEASQLSLSTCFRCSAAVIKEAQKLVPDIYPRDNAPEGSVTSIPYEQLATSAAIGDAILCRLNRPNIAAALALVAADIPVKIEGRDIGQKLMRLLKTANKFAQNDNLYESLSLVSDYIAEESTALAATNRATAAAMLQDEGAALELLIEKTLADGGDNYADLEHAVQRLFADDVNPAAYVTISTVHKAKGREWPKVFILGRGDYMPFHLASLPWELEQEDNIIYVAITRAELDLVYVTGVEEALKDRAKALAKPTES